jgi:hypothetical protein
MVGAVVGGRAVVVSRRWPLPSGLGRLRGAPGTALDRARRRLRSELVALKGWPTECGTGRLSLGTSRVESSVMRSSGTSGLRGGMLTETDLQRLQERGFCLLPRVAVAEFKPVAAGLGTPCATRRDGSIIDTLVPKQKVDAQPGTISSHHGLGQFPWHSDGAVDRDPPRFVLLRAETVDDQSATTDVLDLSSLRDGQLFKTYSRLSCEVKTREYAYMAPFVTQRHGRSCAKWDPLRMRPLGRCASDFLTDVTGAKPTERHRWTSGDLLIIDNWRCLHRRSEASTRPRVIQRIVVKNRPEW